MLKTISIHPWQGQWAEKEAELTHRSQRTVLLDALARGINIGLERAIQTNGQETQEKENTEDLVRRWGAIGVPRDTHDRDLRWALDKFIADRGGEVIALIELEEQVQHGLQNARAWLIWWARNN